MTVRYATQVLSESMKRIMHQYYPEFNETAVLCGYMDLFFDCLNVRNQTEGISKRKPFLHLCRSCDDERLTWLKCTFLPYFEEWKNAVATRDEFTQQQKEKMFIPIKTYEGILITTHSLIESVKYLLGSGVKFVLSERFNQDVLEEYFGRQRSLGRFNDTPNLFQFGYNSNTIRMQRSVVTVEGNSKGAHSQKQKLSWSRVDNQPLKKRLRKKM